MGAVTYPDAAIARFVNENFVPVQINVIDHPAIPEHYMSTWTPSILYIDEGGHVHRRHYGYRYPEDMIVEMHMGLAWEAFDNKRFDEAVERFENIVKDYARSFLAPEALYMVGVARYRATGDGSNLDKYWDLVMERYPGSLWAKAGDV